VDAGRPAMKRGQTAWQVLVLLLVFTVTAGVYGVLAVSVGRIVTDGGPALPAATSKGDDAVQIAAPLDGSVVQDGAVVAVQAAVMEPGFLQAELVADGNVIAVWFNADPDSVPWVMDMTWAEAGEGLHRLAVEAGDGNGRQVSSAPVTVAVVPAGRLYFASNRDGAYALYGMQSDGHDLARLTSGPGDARQPAAAPDGSLAFVVEGEGGQATIRKMAGQGDEATDLAAGRDPAWSGDGRLAYAASVEGISQVMAGAVQVTSETIYAGQPAWSPDGQRIAYVAEDEGDLDVWIAAADGSRAQRLASDPAVDWAPAWSPDGAWLAFVSDRSGSHQIYRVRTDGTGLQRLTDFARGAESPAWSPDGYWLAFVAYTGAGSGVNGREIYLMRADGREQVQLTHNSSDDTEPEWAETP
jgi:dipeptidyl aminopeptidase/acylaminoacyl peptidase